MKQIRKLLIQTSLVIVLAHPVWAANQQMLFDSANTLYQHQKYSEAVSLYNQMIQSGFVSAEIYFNLGNAYYKTADIPASILNYERALRLKPDDPDIEFNLKLANSLTIDKIEPIPQVFYKKWWKSFILKSSALKRALAASLLLWICFICVAAWLFIPPARIRKIAFSLSLVSLAFATGLFLLAYAQQHYLNNSKEGIIFQTNVYVKSSPDENSNNLFMLHGGAKVQLIDELNEWKRIRLPNGHEGWLRNEAVQKI
ncbi:MAG: tetratricopeptide repeat protein [Bacteroidia bacterium]|nr:SH3 domain-containing protein [Bacteroidia bacterium]MCZ2276605.1 tetratricopeptide repeat protein [Bacteroidia bacterium]